MGETNFDIVVADGVQVTGGRVTKTVGIGKDFESFHKAMTWACQQVTKNQSQIVLSLDAGTHYIGEPEDFDDYMWGYYDITNSIRIVGAGKASTFITLPSTDDGGNAPTIWNINQGTLFIEGVTIDPILGGYPYDQQVDVALVYNGRCTVLSCNVSNASSAFNGNKISFFSNCVIDSCLTGTFFANGTNIVFNNTTISNCGTGIAFYAQDGGYINVNGTTFTTNTLDTAFPINQVQYDGSLIANGTSAITLKA